ncbi:hypothetical protein ACFCYX_19480 [Streptomyces populi]|uniref:hypothetical protein n=1 Tax=Streptomyces populi TaxID=2058924 RepID=UPI0035D5B11C
MTPVQLEAQPSIAQLLADTYLQAAARWDAAAAEANRAWRGDLVRLYTARAEENRRLAREAAKPPARDWDDVRTCARDDDRYWDDRYDRDED